MSNITDFDISSLKRKGFINIKNFFPKEDINMLSSELDKLYPDTTGKNKNNLKNIENQKITPNKTNKADYLVDGSYHQGTFGAPILGCSKIIDKFMQKFFNNEDFENLKKFLVGKNSKIFTFHYRVLNPEAKRLMLHQDDFCQLTFQIPLNSIKESDSSTCFVEGSHLSKFVLLDKLFGSISKFLPKFLIKLCYKKYTAEIGDLGIFLNKTFHGTDVNKNPNSSKSILIAINAEGGHHHKKIYNKPQTTLYNEDFKKSIGEKIYNQLFGTEQLVRFEDKYFTFQKENTSPTKIISLASTGPHRNITCLNNTFQNNNNFVNQIIFNDEKIPFKTKVIINYLKLIIFTKNLLRKIVKLK